MESKKKKKIIEIMYSIIEKILVELCSDINILSVMKILRIFLHTYNMVLMRISPLGKREHL